MGGACCIVAKKDRITVSSSLNKENDEHEPKSTKQEDNNFEDMEEYDDIYVGEGIRRIKAYKCLLPYDKLVVLRENFWLSQKGMPFYILTAIRNACAFEASVAQQLLTENGLEAIDGCMKTIVDIYTGEIYRIPNYCICEPTFVKKFEDSDDTAAELLNLKMFDFYGNRTTLVTIMSNKKGIDLKELYAIENGLIFDKITIRLIYRGFEITDDLILNKVKFDEFSNISVSIRYRTITDEQPVQNILIAENSKKILFEEVKNVEKDL